MALNKTKIVQRLYENYGSVYRKHEIDHIVSKVFEAFKNSLESGEEVLLTGIGTLKRNVRKSRNGVNPSTNEPIVIPETNSVKFKLSNVLKSKLNA